MCSSIRAVDGDVVCAGEVDRAVTTEGRAGCDGVIAISAVGAIYEQHAGVHGRCAGVTVVAAEFLGSRACLNDRSRAAYCACEIARKIVDRVADR